MISKTRRDCFLYLYLSFAITIIGIYSLFQYQNTISVSREIEIVIDNVAQKSAVSKQEPDYQQQLMFLDIANSTTISANDASSQVTSSKKTSFNEEHKEHGKKFVDDMDLSRQLQCGKQKCFIPSISDQKIGYLVEKNPYREAYASQLARHVNEVANWIDREFHEGMHFHLGNSFTVHLNKTVARNFYRVTDPSTRTREQKQAHGSRIVTVQKMKKAPDGALFFGCHMLHYEKFRRSKVPFLKKVNEAGNIKEFTVNIMKGYRIMEKVLEAKPDFVYDFQAMIDLNGNLYFIDLDGHIGQRNIEQNVRKYCPNRSGPLCSKKCLRRLESNLIDDPIRNLNLTGSYKK